MLAIATDVTVSWSSCPSVTLVHPAKAVGRNEMPFSSDTRNARSNIVKLLDYRETLVGRDFIRGQFNTTIDTRAQIQAPYGPVYSIWRKATLY